MDSILFCGGFDELSRTIEIVSWNVHGIRNLHHKKAIENAIGTHDVACLQEVWRRSSAKWFIKHAHWGWWFKSSGWVWRLFQRSGLLLLSNARPYRKRGWSFRTPLSILFRGSKEDWVTAKGFTLAQYEWGWLCHLHLDAGGEMADIAARGNQVWKLTKTLLKRVPYNSPLFVVGDFNLSYKRFQDGTLLEDFQTAHRLNISIRAPGDGKDMILYRNASWIGGKTEDAEGLSDHPRLRARFEV